MKVKNIHNAYLDTLVKYRIAFLVTAVSIVVLGGIFYFAWPKTYVSNATLLLLSPAGRSGVASEDGLKASLLLSIGGGALGTANQQKLINILSSRSLSERVVEDLQLQKDFGNEGPLTNDMRAAIASNLSSESVKLNTRKQGIIELKLSYKDRVRTKQLADSYLKNLRTYLNDTTLTMGKRSQIFLERESQAAEKALDEARAALNTFQATHRIVTAESAMQNYQSSYDQVWSSLLSSKMNENYLEQYLTPENPYREAEARRISALKSQLNQLETGAFQTKKKLSQNPSKESGGQTQTSLVLEYLKLERSMLLKQMIYEALQKEFQIAKIDANREDLGFEVLDPPLEPKGPAFPNLQITVVATTGLLLSVLVTLFWLLHSHRLQQEVLLWKGGSRPTTTPPARPQLEQ